MVLWFYVQELPKAQPAVVLVLSTALAKNHAKPAKGDTSHVTKMNFFFVFPN